MRSSTISIATLLAASIILSLTVNAQQQSPQWITVNSGAQIPSNAVVGGNETNGTSLYVALGLLNNQWMAGKTRKDWNYASVPDGLKETNLLSYKVLVGDREYFWQYTPRNTFYANAVKADGKEVYVCRCEYAGSTQVGATWQGALGCYFGYGGNAVYVESYSLLYYTPTQPKPDPVVDNQAKPDPNAGNNSSYQLPQDVPPVWMAITNGNAIPGNALVAGWEADGKPIYVAMAKNENLWIMGKTRRDWSFASIPVWPNEKTISEYQVLLSDRKYFWQPAPRNVFYANGVTKHTVTPTYVCRCEYNGGMQIGLTWDNALGCIFGYGGKAVAVKNYSLLLYEPPLGPYDTRALNLKRPTPVNEHLTGNEVIIQPLSNPGQYMIHTSEMKIQPLPAGPQGYLSYREFKLGKSLITSCTDCISLAHHQIQGQYLKQQGNKLVMAKDDQSVEFGIQATFRRIDGLAGTGFSYESMAMPGQFIIYKGNEFMVTPAIDDNSFRSAATFIESYPVFRKPISIRSFADTTQFLMANNAYTVVADKPTTLSRQQAQFVLGGSANKQECYECVTLAHFGAQTNNTVRENNFYLTTKPASYGTPIWREANFIRRPGLWGRGFSYESKKYPGYFIRFVGNGVLLAQYHNSEEFKRSVSFEEVKGLGYSTRAVF